MAAINNLQHCARQGSVLVTMLSSLLMQVVVSEVSLLPSFFFKPDKQPSCGLTCCSANRHKSPRSAGTSFRKQGTRCSTGSFQAGTVSCTTSLLAFCSSRARMPISVISAARIMLWSLTDAYQPYQGAHKLVASRRFEIVQFKVMMPSWLASTDLGLYLLAKIVLPW